MAENEILDVGSPRRYRKWRSALGNSALSPEQAADCLREEFVALTRKSLQGTPLYLILQACDQGRAAAQAAIDSCKNHDLASLANSVIRTATSKNIYELADKIASRLYDRIQGRVRLYALKQGLDAQQLATQESATASALRSCRAEIVTQLMASLGAAKLPKLQQPRVRRERTSARTLSETSLLTPSQSPPGAQGRV